MSALPDELFREESARVIGALMRRFGNLDLAEDAFQDACVAALETWPVDGLPRSPGAWLTTVAGNRALDRIRRESLRGAKELAAGDRARSAGADLDAELALLDAGPLDDDQLSLVFLCCHPALSTEAQLALTLRAVAGLSTEEIARAFLVPEPTMAQRLVRAKRKIALAGIQFRMPDEAEVSDRIATVLRVVYLVFNAGYTSGDAKPRDRPDLCREALRLAALLHRLRPEDAEVVGLHALLVLHEARRHSRFDSGGELVPLEEQDRAQWDAPAIAHGVALVEESLRLGPVGPYQLQAAVAALHAEAASTEATDWAQIVELYRLHEVVAPSPLVRLNLGVALAMRDGPEAGLAVLDQLDVDGSLAGHHRLPAARAQLLERAGRRAEALDAYDDALRLVDNEPDREYLARRRERLAGS